MKNYYLSGSSQITKQAIFSCSLLGKASEKQTKTILNQAQQQIKRNGNSYSLIKKYDHISKNNRVSYETRTKGDIELEKVREI